MRVLALIDSLEQGGAEQSLAAVWPYLGEHRVDAEVAVLRDTDGPPRHRIDELGGRVHVIRASGRVGRVREVARLLRHQGFDLVHTSLFESDLTGRLAGLLAGVPVVTSLVSTGPSTLAIPAWKRGAATALEVATARLTTRFHAVTASVAESQSSRLRVPRSRVDVVWRGRDRDALGEPSEDRRRQVRDALGLGGEPVLLAVGRHVPEKGLDIAIRAVARLRPDAVLLVAGAFGPSSTAMGDLAAALGVADRVWLLGVRLDVPDLLCASDVFVLPSRKEGTAGALIEAAAMGVPAVASDLPVLREVFPGDLVRWVAPDEVDVVSAIEEVLADPVRAASRASAARRWFDKQLSAPVAAARLAALYSKVIGGEPAVPGVGRRLFLDVGAHVGETLAEVVRSRWRFDRIWTFEPASACQPALRALADDRVEVCPFGWWHEDAELELHDPGAIGASIDEGKAIGDVVERCRFVDAARWMSEQVRSDDLIWLKLNCEGAECDVLDRLLDADLLGEHVHLLVHFDVEKIPGRAHRGAETRTRLRRAGIRFVEAHDIMFGRSHAAQTANWLAWTEAPSWLRWRYTVLARVNFRLRQRLYPLKQRFLARRE